MAAKTLQRKFIGIVMLALCTTMFVLFSAINITNFKLTTERADATIRVLYENEGAFPEDLEWDSPKNGFQLREETPYETRYFIAYISENDGAAINIQMEHIAAMDRQGIGACINEIISTGKTEGYQEQYRYHVYNEDGKITIIVLDCFLQLEAMTNVMKLTGSILIACVAVVFIILLFLSKKAIRPFIENMERQRQFVTDASHELKTPLAIISANTGILEMNYGENQWLSSTNSQILRMDHLIRNLIELAKDDEVMMEEERSQFSISEMILSHGEAFQALAEERQIGFETHIADNLTMRGLQESVFRLSSILIDNAIKYCDDNGKVTLTLAKKGRFILLSVANSCRDVNHGQMLHFFDRFYRADSSRSRDTGGFGIGLSAAKAIVRRHRGRINVNHVKRQLIFNVLLPQ